MKLQKIQVYLFLQLIDQMLRPEIQHRERIL